MKILSASCLNRNCGIGQYTENLAINIRKFNKDIEVLRKGNADHSLFFNYPYRSFRSLQYYVAPFYLAKAIKNWDADILHADYVDSGMALYLSKKKVPFITTVHDAIPFSIHKNKIDFSVYKLNLKKSIKISKKLIVVSNDAKIDLIKHTNLHPNKIEVIYNGVNHAKFHPIKNVENEIFTVKYLGGITTPHKNVISILEAAKILQKTPIQFVIGGYLPEKSWVRTFVEKNNLKNITFQGLISDNEHALFYQTADVFVFPSFHEGFGLPPLEAMACGIPTIVSDIPVFREIFEKAAHFSIPNPQDIAEAILNLKNNESLRTDLSYKGLVQSAKYSWEKTAEQTINVYKELYQKSYSVYS